MNRRAIPGLIVVVLALAGIVVAGRTTEPLSAPVFSTQSGAWMPAVSDTGSLTGTWFCPGVPATGEDGVGGEVVVSNRDDQQLKGRFTILTPDGEADGNEFTVDPWAQTTIEVNAFVQASYASVVVEVEGGAGVVEQRAIHPAGTSVAACSNDTSADWYLADGFTLDGSTEALILTNPYDDPVIANLSFATSDGTTDPAAFQGFPIPPRTVQVIQFPDLASRDEPVIAVHVHATAGRLVLGRAQHYTGGGRLGYGVTLAAPATRDQFWFADGETGSGITETYAIYNPTDDEVAVDVFFLGIPLEADIGNLESITVPPREVVVFDTADVEGLPEGRHATVFSTLSVPSIVVERILTRPAGDAVATTVVVGAPPRQDGYVASQWHAGVGPESATEDALVVFNIDNADGSISVQAIGPNGPVEVPALTDIPIGAGRIVTIDLTDPDVVDRELIITSDRRIFVERSYPRGADLAGRSGSWALPFSS